MYQTGCVCRVLAQEQGLLPHVLGTFLGRAGIGQPNEVSTPTTPAAQLAFILSSLRPPLPSPARQAQPPAPAPFQSDDVPLSTAASSATSPCLRAACCAQALATRACYLFCRLMKALRGEMRPHVAAILQGLEPHLRSIITTPRAEPPQGTRPSAGA